MSSSPTGYMPTTTSVDDDHNNNNNNHVSAEVVMETFEDEESISTTDTSASADGNRRPSNSSSAVWMSLRDRMLQRHDSVFSVASDYEDPSANDLNLWQGAALLTADCLGTGLLALPEDIQVLGRVVGIGFLVVNLPINLYAGTILAEAADHVERVQADENQAYEERQAQVLQMQQQQNEIGGEIEEEGDEHLSATSKDGLMTQDSIQKKPKSRGIARDYHSVEQTEEQEDNPHGHQSADVHDENDTSQGSVQQMPASSGAHDEGGITIGAKQVNPHKTVHHDTATFDLVGMTQALFSSRRASRWVMIIFYTNIFLVLGDYILVMSHAVSALVGEDVLCLPQAGILASTLMYAVTQTRTMANLGRAATIISLSALAIVVFQCLWAVHVNITDVYVEASSEDFDKSPSLLRKFSALGSIGFATGSQKLFLNIRHELADRRQGPKSLAVSLSAFGAVYIGIVLLAGSHPPGFLFDSISPGWNRRLAGLLLWIHVVVSYAINSQAICSSMDRLFFSTIPVFGLNEKPRIRWMCLTGIMSIMAFVVANAIPFFKDLVAFIGALTSIPLALMFPAVFYRRYLRMPIWFPSRESLWSYSLLAFSVGFMAVALAGSISSIEMDWSNHGGPFSCH